MIELESDAYTMNEEETKSLKVKRVGGTKGRNNEQNYSQIQALQFRTITIQP